MLVERPELGTLGHRCAASLAGFAPMAHDSGQHRDRRFIRGGRASARELSRHSLVEARLANVGTLVGQLITLTPTSSKQQGKTSSQSWVD
jgi:hypothetical protein